MIEITIRELSGRGVYEAVHEGRVLATSDCPLLAAARRLLDLGVAPETKIQATRASGTVALSSTVGAAAKLRVKHLADGRPVFAEFKEFAPF